MISFGTDGWRGIIADEFTFENVRVVTQAVCDYIRESGVGSREQQTNASTPRGEDLGEGHTTPCLVIGYDTRFLSDKFARAAAEVVAANGIKVLLADAFAPTPAVSYAVVDRSADGAIMITASHNTFKYNGLKFKAPYGGSASPKTTKAIEKSLEQNITSGREPKTIDYDDGVSAGLIELFDPKGPYLARLAELVDTTLLRGARVVVDPMYGAGRGYLSDFLRSAGCDVLEINDYDEPYFGHVQPEPLEQNLGGLVDTVRGEWPIGIGLDGDADRVGAVDFSGEFINSHMIVALLLRYLHEEKGMSGQVVKTVSTTCLIDIMAAAYGLPVHETPVGFKYICDAMLANNVLIGGEESGGIGIKGHIPERDGILMGALLVETINHYGLSLSEQWQDLQRQHGRFFYARADIELELAEKDVCLERLDVFRPDSILETEVTRLNKVDGYKHCLADGSWLMFRMSGTEPVVRIYAEAGSADQAAALLACGTAIALGKKPS